MLGSALGHADYVLTHHRLHGRRTRPCAHYPRAPASACQGSHTPVIDRRCAGSRWGDGCRCERAHIRTTFGRGQPDAVSRPSQVGFARGLAAAHGEPSVVSERSCFASCRSAHASKPCLSGLIQWSAACQRHPQPKCGLNANPCCLPDLARWWPCRRHRRSPRRRRRGPPPPSHDATHIAELRARGKCASSPPERGS